MATGVAVVYGPRTICAYDNLLANLRELFYEAEARGKRPTSATTSPRVLAAFDSLVLTTDIGIAQAPRFRGCPVRPVAEIGDEWRFYCDEELVGVLQNIS